MSRTHDPLLDALAEANPVPAPASTLSHPVANALMEAITAEPRPRATTRPRIKMRMRVVAAVAALVVAGGFAVATTTSPMPYFSGPGGFPVASEDARAALEQHELVREAPWLSQPHGSPSLDEVDALPSLIFPAGTTYDQAITALYVAAKGSGELPSDATLGPPLPKDIVISRSADHTALSLTAPFGYDVKTGNVLMPSLAWPAGLTSEEVQASVSAAGREGRVVPEGARVVGNYLDPCQAIVDGERGPACR